MDDHSQLKLSKTEWAGIEIQCSDEEKQILQLITDGYYNPQIRRNLHLSLFLYIKLDPTPALEYFLYQKYFESLIQSWTLLYGGPQNYSPKVETTLRRLKSADQIRMKNTDNLICNSKSSIYEFVVLEFAREILANLSNPTAVFYYYTLVRLQETTHIDFVNIHVIGWIKLVLDYARPYVTRRQIVYHAYECIEKNPHCFKYEDLKVHRHQQEIFNLFRNHPDTPKLVLYSAPTGTGKTLTPLGLSQQFRVIFVCAKRHVGLALARAAITMGKRVAFAFGCDTASDIRLHYFAATSFTKNKKSGGIGKVDNSIGDRVELMICDVKSYLVAQHYMLAFHIEPEILTYWDEPTISMDYETHSLHEQIHKNWVNNKIGKVVLSCATLPKETEIMSTVMDFQMRFVGSTIHSIQSFDCKKSITLLDKDQQRVLPHLLFANRPSDLLRCVQHCKENKTLLRYMDLKSILEYIRRGHEEGWIESSHQIEQYFVLESDISMESLKLYYLYLLDLAQQPPLQNIHKIISVDSAMEVASTKSGQPLSRSLTHASLNPYAGVLITTEDAHTLTDGPTLYLAENTLNMAKFYLHQSNVPASELAALMEKLDQNNKILKKIQMLENQMEDALGEEIDKEKKMIKEGFSKESRKWMEQIHVLRDQVAVMELKSRYVPNTKEHQDIWCKIKGPVKNAFLHRVEEQEMKDVLLMECPDVFKVLMLLGIGVFSAAASIQYLERMKKMADEQKLFVIIASSDYVYGTNYQFCHCFIGKDLQKMTQQKTIQALGRVGRNKVQQDYSVRFRDNELIQRLYLPVEYNLEAVKMSELFCS